MYPTEEQTITYLAEAPWEAGTFFAEEEPDQGTVMKAFGGTGWDTVQAPVFEGIGKGDQEENLFFCFGKLRNAAQERCSSFSNKGTEFL